MNPSHATNKSEKVTQAASKPPVEENDIPTVILDGAFFRRRARSTEGEAKEATSSRTHTFPQR